MICSRSECLFWGVGRNQKMIRCFSNLSQLDLEEATIKFTIMLLCEQSHFTLAFWMIKGESSCCIWNIAKIESHFLWPPGNVF